LKDIEFDSLSIFDDLFDDPDDMDLYFDIKDEEKDIYNSENYYVDVDVEQKISFAR